MARPARASPARKRQLVEKLRPNRKPCSLGRQRMARRCGPAARGTQSRPASRNRGRGAAIEFRFPLRPAVRGNLFVALNAALRHHATLRGQRRPPDGTPLAARFVNDTSALEVSRTAQQSLAAYFDALTDGLKSEQALDREGQRSGRAGTGSAVAAG